MSVRLPPGSSLGIPGGGLLSVFTSSPQFSVIHRRAEIGRVDPFVLVRKVAGPRVLALAGRGWLVTAIDWSRRRAHVEPVDTGGAARWISVGQPKRMSWSTLNEESSSVMFPNGCSSRAGRPITCRWSEQTI